MCVMVFDAVSKAKCESQSASQSQQNKEIASGSASLSVSRCGSPDKDITGFVIAAYLLGSLFLNQ